MWIGLFLSYFVSLCSILFVFALLSSNYYYRKLVVKYHDWDLPPFRQMWRNKVELMTMHTDISRYLFLDESPFQNYIARFGHGSAKLARQAQSKEKTLAKMVAGGLTEKVSRDKSLTFYFPDCGKVPPPVREHFSSCRIWGLKDRMYGKERLKIYCKQTS